MVEEVILPHRPHVRAQPLSHLHPKLLEGEPLPFGCRLYDLGVDWVLVVIVRNMELDRGT